MMVGTVSYMPPEQALGGKVDTRSDLYGLGASLYETLTGRPPFSGHDPVAVISQHLNTPPGAPSWDERGRWSSSRRGWPTPSPAWARWSWWWATPASARPASCRSSPPTPGCGAPRSPGAPASAGEAEAYRPFQEVTEFLKNASASAPLLLVLEDLQWADKGSCSLLQHLARRLAGGRLLVAISCREV